MTDHMKPLIKEKPDHIILYTTINGLNSDRAPYHYRGPTQILKKKRHEKMLKNVKRCQKMLFFI